jgi:Ca2+/Na+ antiporter
MSDMNNTARSMISCVLLLGWLAVLISVAASTADTFFVPSLQHLAQHWQLAPDLAGNVYSNSFLRFSAQLTAMTLNKVT